VHHSVTFFGAKALAQSVLVALLLALSSAPAFAVPSFARQTGMTCSACHTVFPELTPFGREFKLNGYVVDNLRQIKGGTMERRETLSLNTIPPLSAMIQVSYTHTGAPLPDSAITGALAKDGDVLFPDQFSLFYAGKIANDLGAFIQATYTGADDHFGLDNTDIRYARYVSVAEPGATGAQGARGWLASHDILVGLTLNNNPTVQDPWNSSPAWGFPFISSSVAPSPIAGTKIDGGLAQSVAGLGAYAWIDHALYVEFSLYSEAIIGGAHPLDSTQAQVVRGVSPYWRVGYEYRWDRNALFVGTYGIQTSILPGAGHPLSGPTDRFTDVAVDTQYQFIGDENLVSFLATYIHEDQHLDASNAYGAAANTSNSLKTIKATVEYNYRRTIGGSVGFFSTTGSTDTLLYPNDGTVNGSLVGSPDSRGYILEVDYLPFLNTKLAVQYVGYSKFNGASSDYAGIGRSASDNNTLYLQCWISF
jgi:hypothetical protein